MKQRIYRYIAIALGSLAVLSTIGELRLGQIPIVAMFLLAGAKQFYDNSVGRVYAADNRSNHFSTYDSSTPFVPNEASPFDDYHGVSASWGRGDNPFGGGRMIDND